jgi:hypothetical protein
VRTGCDVALWFTIRVKRFPAFVAAEHSKRIMDGRLRLTNTYDAETDQPDLREKSFAL